MKVLLPVAGVCCALAAAPVPGSLRPRLALLASFDRGLDADQARGDRRIYSAPDYKQQASAKPGPGDVDAAIEKGVGIAGSPALRFRSKNTRALFFRGERNVSPTGGTFSFWLRLDPDKDLAPGFCDPVQITDKAYNDSAIWVDFTRDETPRHFRLGVFGSLRAWNPDKSPDAKHPVFLRRLVVVEKPPFSRDAWTHVAIRWEGLDREGAGSASLFLNGRLIGPAQGMREAFEWDPARLAIRLGVNYTGLMDEVAVFDRALSAREIETLYRAGSRR